MLSMEEFADRMGAAFQAVTDGDLAPLCADLPASAPVLVSPGTSGQGRAPVAAGGSSAL